MQASIFLLSFLLMLGALCAAAIQRRRIRARRKGAAAAEGSLWMELAAGLFERDEAPASARMEIALAAISRKLGLRAAIVTRHDHNHCAVIAGSSVHPALLRGLERGSVVARSSLFCGSVRSGDPSLSIDYASLSEWRGHPAQGERGWESFVGVACGTDGVVVSFFDTRPRTLPLTRAERTLVEQLAPWIAAMVSVDHALSPALHPVLATQREL
jgi:hypothetical protein